VEDVVTVVEVVAVTVVEVEVEVEEEEVEDAVTVVEVEAEAVLEVIVVVLKCIRLHVPIAVIDAKYHLNLPAKNLFFAVTVSKTADEGNQDQEEMTHDLVLMTSQSQLVIKNSKSR